ncbi:uncharacterized protein LOC134271849 [Saccostrea cucullata]|uniref:uncharacterized protein LOC134271849 n=1 Tax=Saccostrea cuccullata TaxID=36930 RepID=UPI002ED63B95
MKLSCPLHFTVYISFFICKALATTYYCEDKQTVNIDGVTSGTIRTLASGASSYDNNVDCSWKINAGSGNKLHFRILSSVLEYTPPYTSCYTRDSLFILDGETASSEVLVSICGYFNPYEVTSKGQHVYLRFSTNDKNFYQYSGIILQFEAFGNTSCPPDWKELSPLECYKIMTQPVDGLTWSNAQEYCGYSLSNLIILPTEDIFTAFQAYAVNMSVSNVWIGLNDIEVENAIKWISGTTGYLQNRLDTSSETETKDCVIHDTQTQKWTFKYCSRDKFPFACQRHKVKETDVFKVPEAIDKADFEPVSLRWVIILSISGGIVLIIIITVIYCRCKHIKARRIREGLERRQTYQASSRDRRPSRTQEPSAPPEEQTPLPSYRPPSIEPDRSSLPPSYEESQRNNYITKPMYT